MAPALLTAVAFVCYIASMACYGATAFLLAPASPAFGENAPPPQNLGRFARPLLFLGAFMQFWAIGAWCVTTHRSPFAGSFGTLSVTAWTIALAFGVLEPRKRLPAVGAIVVSITCFVLFAALLQAKRPVAETPILLGELVSLHVMTTLASFGIFAVSSICAVFYLLQNRLLRQHRKNALFRRLPPLETLDKTAYHAAAYALPLLTLGLVLGILRTFDAALLHPTKTWLFDPHALTAMAAWFVYLFYFVARLALNWRGTRLQYLLIFALAIVLSVYLMPTATHRFR